MPRISSAGIYRSDDGGDTWAGECGIHGHAGPPTPHFPARTMPAQDAVRRGKSDRIYLQNHPGVYRSG